MNFVKRILEKLIDQEEFFVENLNKWLSLSEFGLREEREKLNCKLDLLNLVDLVEPSLKLFELELGEVLIRAIKSVDELLK